MSKGKQNAPTNTPTNTPIQNQFTNCVLEQIAEMSVLIHTGRSLQLSYVEIAEHLYNAGYRKQSEGEWIKHPVSYECTACKEEFFVEGYAEDYDPITDWDLHFCPNCGAKMKGGAEETQVTTKKFFSPEDVRKMSQKEVHENYQAIMDSMKEWK